jgi:hypothetical protein
MRISKASFLFPPVFVSVCVCVLWNYFHSIFKSAFCFAVFGEVATAAAAREMKQQEKKLQNMENWWKNRKEKC